MKRSFWITALALGVFFICPAVSRGQGLSPVGSWQVTILGADNGTAMMTFSNDFTVSGYGITRGQLGFLVLTGNWHLDTNGDVIVAYLQSIDGVGTGGASFTAQLLHGGKFRAKGSDNNHKRLRFKGEQPTDLPDLRGSWTDEVKRRGKNLFEAYTITASTNFPDVFDVTGNGLSNAGSYTLAGEIIADSHNNLNAAIDRTFGVDTQHSSLFGKLKPSRPEMFMTGVDDTPAHLKVKATQ